jgi:hypothetical protein
MKAHLPPGTHLSSTERKRLIESLEQKRRWYKLVLIALHNDFGFGPERMEKMIDSLNRFSDQQKTDEVFWEHVDHLLINELGLPFDRENYEKVDK